MELRQLRDRLGQLERLLRQVQDLHRALQGAGLEPEISGLPQYADLCAALRLEVDRTRMALAKAERTRLSQNS